MQNILKKALSKKGRAALYALVAAILALAGTYGLLTADQAASLTASAGTLFSAAAPILALFNLTDDDTDD